MIVCYIRTEKKYQVLLVLKYELYKFICQIVISIENKFLEASVTYKNIKAYSNKETRPV